MSSIAISLIFATVTGAAVAPAGPPDGVFDPPPIVRHQLEEGASKRAMLRTLRDTGEAGLKSWAPPAGPIEFDVLHYDLDVYVDPVQEILSGTVGLELEAVRDGLGSVTLDADLGLRMLSVLQVRDDSFLYDTPVDLAFEHTGDRLTIDLVRPLAAGESIRLQLTYGGHASRLGLIGSTGVNWLSNGGTPVIHTFAQPFGARVWWPCNDRPDDKATVTMAMTVPTGLDIASNGLERSSADNDDGTTTSVWASAYPVPTYLVVMHISDFVYSEDTYTGFDGTTMPVALWAMPEVADQAETDLAVTVPQIEVMAGHWGEYPFLDEKYGNATVFFGGGMEHQTMTTLSVYYVGDPWMEWLNVHELGHQWWGDWVTMDDWRHIWLNEGYATHTEWLWAEHRGPDVFEQYLEDEDYLGQFHGSVYDNPEPFSWTIYAKGSWVAWMLRHVVGDETFFEAMASYRAAHGGATATTEDLENAMESGSGMELDWFFDQWVYAPNRPRYVYSWEAVDGPALELTVRQAQTNAGLFRMPMIVRVTTDAGEQDFRVWFEDEIEQTITIELEAVATGVEIDPETRVLCEIAHVSEPDLDLGPDFPDGLEFGVLMTSESATLEIPLTNTGGIDLVIQGIWPQSGGSFGLDNPPDFPLTITAGTTYPLSVVFDPAGQGHQTDWFYIQSNDPDRDGGAFFQVRGTAALFNGAYLVGPATTSVGRVPLGGTGEASFDIRNIGSEPVTLTTTIEEGDFFLASTIPPVLAPGDVIDVHVRYHPTRVGNDSAIVSFTPADSTTPSKTVSVRGTAESAPRLELSPAAVALGIGDAATTAELHLSNTGTEDLIVSTTRILPPFTVLEPVDGSLVIPQGSSTALIIGLEDPMDGTHHGRLSIHSNDPSIPVALVPTSAHVTDDPTAAGSFPAAAAGPGLGNARWSTTAFLLNTGDDDVQIDLKFRPPTERGSANPDVGLEVPARTQRVVSDLVRVFGVEGTGGVNLRASHDELVAASRTFASDPGGTYGQYIPAVSHLEALIGTARYLLAGLSGNDDYHTNIGVLNLGEDLLEVDFRFFDADGGFIGGKRITAAPNAFAQNVAVISKLTQARVRGGYATLTAVAPDARYLAYASVVDDLSHDPTLAMPQDLDENPDGMDLIVAAVASSPGAGGTTWRSQISAVNTSAEPRSVTLEYNPVGGTSVTGMPMQLEPGATLHFDDLVGGLFGTTGKGWLRVSASGAGVHATSRTYNDDAAGTYGQLIPALPLDPATGGDRKLVLPGLSSSGGFRTNIGITSVDSVPTSCVATVYESSGVLLGTREIEIPPNSLVQIDGILSEVFGYLGTGWAELDCGSDALVFAYASVVDGATGDPTYIPAKR